MSPGEFWKFMQVFGLKRSIAAATSIAWVNITGKPSFFSGVYSDLTSRPTLFSGAYSDLTGKPNIGRTVVGTTEKTGSFRVYKNATVASGVAVFHLTDDGLSSGAALFTEVYTDSVQPVVSDAAASYQMGWVFSNANKTLTVTANKLTTANILTGLLGQAQANGSTIRLTVEGR